MAQANHIMKVAIVGASGRIGGAFAASLLKTRKHTVTAITHGGSKGKLPDGVKIARVDYNDDGSSLVSALQGQQFLAITLSVTAPPDLHDKIVKAAVKAGVPYIMPNTYGGDTENERLIKESAYLQGALQKCKEIERLGATYISLACGFWYEWSLALGEQWFGFNIKDKTVTFFDDGKTRISVSTWDQCGRAFAALLSLPETGASPCLADWKNKPVYIASFLVSQRDMLNSIHRVTGSTDADWTITHEPTDKRYKDGLAEMQKGMQTGFAKSMYSRTFYPNGDGDLSTRGLANDVLGLPKEDLDEATKRALKMVESGWNPFAQ